MSHNTSRLQTNLLGATVRFAIHGGGHDTGTIRVVYLSNNGWPMFLVEAGSNLVVVSPDSARVVKS